MHVRPSIWAHINKPPKYLVCLFCFYCLLSTSQAQDKKVNFLIHADSLNKKRVYGLAASGIVVYGGALIVLNEFWYKDFPRSSFHFFDDSGEWLQIDKVGHVYTAYFEGVWGTRLVQWTGVGHRKALWYGGLTGKVIQTVIEILDGYSDEWGASVADLISNSAGSGLALLQEKYFGEQRMQMKFSFHPVTYASDVQDRATDLYGTGFAEKLIKDYNGQTYWLSVNPSLFAGPDTKLPKWLSLSIGYGGDGILGGFANTWKDNGMMIDRTDIPRLRQYYLSVDLDLTQIPTRSPLLRTILDVANIIKFPAPALELNSVGDLKFHLVYF